MRSWANGTYSHKGVDSVIGPECDYVTASEALSLALQYVKAAVVELILGLVLSLAFISPFTYCV